MKNKDEKPELAKRLIKRKNAKFSDADARRFIENTLEGDTKYSITPKGILWLAIDKFFGGGTDKLEQFSEYLLEQLSRLVTDNKNPGVFGSDFNDFMKLYIDTLNLCGRMKEKLDENGIEFDPDDGD